MLIWVEIVPAVSTVEATLATEPAAADDIKRRIDCHESIRNDCQEFQEPPVWHKANTLRLKWHLPVLSQANPLNFNGTPAAEVISLTGLKTVNLCGTITLVDTPVETFHR